MTNSTTLEWVGAPHDQREKRERWFFPFKGGFLCNVIFTF